MPNVDTRPCPSCRRQNASFRGTCLYCGVPIPNPSAPPPPSAPREIPDLDDLVRRALSGAPGSLGKIKQALRDPPPGTPDPPPSGPAAPPAARPAPDSTRGAPPAPAPDPWAARPSFTAPAPDPWAARPSFTAPASGSASPPPPPGVAPAPDAPTSGGGLPQASALIHEVVGLLQVAQGTLGRGATGEALRFLGDARARIDAAIHALDAQSTPRGPGHREIEPLSAVAEVVPDFGPVDPAELIPPVELPPQRAPFALMVDGPGDRNEGPGLAAALRIDAATARMHVVARYPRAVLRGDALREMETLADQVRRKTPLFASVQSREALQALPLPAAVVGGDSRGYRVVPIPLWLMELDPSSIPPGEIYADPRPVLAVPGTVVIRRFSTQTLGSSRQKGLGGQREASERRLHVVDLYPEEGAGFRVVLGITRFQGLPGYVPASAIQSLKGFIEALESRPRMRVEGSRTCHPWQSAATLPKDGQAEHLLTGWPVWEEHTRMCRLHHRARRGG